MQQFFNFLKTKLSHQIMLTINFWFLPLQEKLNYIIAIDKLQCWVTVIEQII